MFTASLYIIVCSTRNRMRVRLRRLREPRYLVGAFVGAAYVYFSFFARFRMARAGDQRRRFRTSPPFLMVSAVRRLARAFDSAPVSFQDLLIRVGTVTTTGLSSIVLWPFIALARPLFAEWPAAYLISLVWSTVVLLAVVAWVLQIDAAFEDAAVAISQ